MRRRDLGLALLVAAGGLALLVWLVPTAPLTGDGEHYVAYARSHLQHAAASSYHARRVLAPLIVSALPVDALLGFHVLTLASLFVAALLTWLAALGLGTVPQSVAYASIAFFLGTWAVASNLREYALVDPLAWAFVAGLWLATVHRSWWYAAVLGASGVLAKEVVLVPAIAAAAAQWSASHGLKGAARAVAVAAPAVLVLAALTVFMKGSGTDVGVYLTGWWSNGLGSLGPLRVVYLTFASYGALWLLVPRGFAMLPGHLKRAAMAYLFAAVVLPFVGSPERMEELIFPAVIAMACMAVSDLRPVLVWTLAIANALFMARVAGDASLPPAVAWVGLLTASGLAISCYVPRLGASGPSLLPLQIRLR